MGRALMIIVVGLTTIFSGIIFNLSSTQQYISSDLSDIHEKWIADNNIESINNVIQSKLFKGTTTVADTFYLDGAKGYYSAAIIGSDSIDVAERIRVTTFSEFKDQKDTTYTTFMRPAYSYYQNFVNTWNANITHTTGDTTKGPFHANAQIQVSGAPVYMSKVSSTNGTGFTATTAVPRGGTEFGINAIPAPNIAPLTTRINTLPGTKRFPAERWIRFLSNGTSEDAPDLAGSAGTYDAPVTIASYSGLIISDPLMDLHVEGTVNGRVTILSGQDIIIEGDLDYAVDPLITLASDDYIGLVATVDIIVNYPTVVTGRTIYGTFLALGDLKIDNFANINPLNLDIVGSLIADTDKFALNDIESFIPATFNKTHKRDPRLQKNTPPYFPRVPNRWEIIYRSN